MEVFAIPTYLQGDYFSDEEASTAEGWRFQPFQSKPKLEIHPTEIILRTYSDSAQYVEKKYSIGGANNGIIRMTDRFTVINLAEKVGDACIGYLPFIVERSNDSIIHCYFPYSPWDRSSRKKYAEAYSLQMTGSYDLIKLQLSRNDLNTITKGTSNLFCSLYRKKDHFLIIDPERGSQIESNQTLSEAQIRREQKHQERSIRHHEHHQIREDIHWKNKINHFWKMTAELKAKNLSDHYYLATYSTYNSPQNGEEIRYQEQALLLSSAQNPDSIRSIISSIFAASKAEKQNVEISGVFIVKPEVKTKINISKTEQFQINGSEVKVLKPFTLTDFQTFLLFTLPIDESFFKNEKGNHLTNHDIRRRLKIIATLHQQ
jgi:hypothetical protein